MYALTKTPVTLETARTLVATHFGANAAIANYTELTEGMFNAAYLIELVDGQKSVLKVAPPAAVKTMRYEKNIMQAEVETMRLVRAHTDVPVPEIFAYDTSHHILDSDYFLMAYVPGTTLHKLRQQLSDAEQSAIDFRSGEFLRQFHTLTGPCFGLYAQPEFQFATWREAYHCLFELVLQDGRDAGVALPIPYATLYERVPQHFSALDEITQPALVHWDLWDGNIFIDPATKQITGVLDFERVLWGDPLMEVNFNVFDDRPALYAGYGREMLSTPSAQVRRTLYNIYLWLVMIIECTYRQYETNDQENWIRPKLVEDFEKLEAGA